MIIGMTGFGACDFTLGKVKGSIEIKSVNHRYLDIAFYLPSGFSSAEEKISKIIAKHIKRGRVTVSVRITDKPGSRVTVNKDVVGQYLSFSKSIAKDYQIKNDISVADIMRLPGVVEAKEVYVQAADIWPAVEKGLVKATFNINNMRKREGKSLFADIFLQLKLMQGQIATIKGRCQAILKQKKSSFTGEEFASFQKANDINEELARLNHHIEEAKILLKNGVEAGKKLDFIAQEMQRESNTIGSKVQDKDVSAAVISLKSKIEKIREQANNVE